MKPRNRSAWLWLGVACCTVSGVMFGVIIGLSSERPLIGALLGLATGLALGVYGARKSIGK
ncbi:MAG: hypothetical protein L0G70_07035 [Rubrobacter sp.]|nr:hypothetical protein [Rubrobacter sp.]